MRLFVFNKGNRADVVLGAVVGLILALMGASAPVYYLAALVLVGSLVVADLGTDQIRPWRWVRRLASNRGRRK